MSWVSIFPFIGYFSSQGPFVDSSVFSRHQTEESVTGKSLNCHKIWKSGPTQSSRPCSHRAGKWFSSLDVEKLKTRTKRPGRRDELCWLLDASYAMVTVMMDRAEEIVNINCFNFYSCVQRRPEETSSVSYRTRHQEQVVKTRLPLSPEQHQSVWIWRNMPFLNATEIGIMYDTRNTESRDRYGQNWAHEHQPLKYFRF